MTALTAVESAAVDAIRRHIEGRGYPPTLRELGAALGLSSPSGVRDVLLRLERKGAIRRAPGPRAITIVDGGGL